MKDFLALRPIFHRLEERVRAHIALCVIAAVIEGVMANDLANADLRHPDLPTQIMTPRRALAELAEIRRHRLSSGGRTIELVDRPTPLQQEILGALIVDTRDWNRAEIA
jgi:hypothetical protein